jgi:hypothetical protein
MTKRIHNAARSAWKRFVTLDRQIAHAADGFAETSLDEPRAVKAMPDYAAIKASADSGARTAGF